MPKPLSVEKFEEKYASLFALDTATNSLIHPSRDVINRSQAELKNWWVVSALKAAEVENCPEVFQILVGYLLSQLGVWPITVNVFRSTRPIGRPPAHRIAWRSWVDREKPDLTAEIVDEFLEQFHSAEFEKTRLNYQSRGKLRRALKAAFRRYEDEVAGTKPASVS